MLTASLIKEIQFHKFAGNGWPETAILAEVELRDLQGILGSEVGFDDIRSFLSSQEIQKFSSFRLDKRRQEWLGGRLAAKYATFKMAGMPLDSWQEVQVFNDAQGRPYLELAAKQSLLHLSISHSHGRAVAMVARQPCGIDLQKAVPAIFRIEEKFTVKGELGVLSSALSGCHSEIEMLTILWAAKEVVRKMIKVRPLLWFEEIRVVRMSIVEPASALYRIHLRSERTQAGEHYDVLAQVREGYVLAFSILFREAAEVYPWK